MKTKMLFLLVFIYAILSPVAFATFNTPVPVGISTTEIVRTPSISADQLTIFFGMYQNSPSEIDVYYATRLSTNSPFGSPIPVTSVNSGQMEWGPDISADGLSLYFARGDTFNNGDIWVATRANVNDPFGAPQIVPELNSSASEAGASLSDDGLSMYVCSSRTGGSGLLDLWRFTRPTNSAPFGSGTNLSEVNTAGEEISPSITADGLTIYWDLDHHNIWSASRADLSSPFSNPHMVAEINYAGYDSGAPDISADGSTIYFMSLRPESLPGNLWMATVIPEPSSIIFLMSGLVSLLVLRIKRG